MRYTTLSSSDELRSRIYDGELLLLHANEASMGFASALFGRVVERLGDNPRKAHDHHTGEEIFSQVCAIREELHHDPIWLDRFATLVASLELDPSGLRVDPPRLRGIQHNGHLIEAAAPAYYAHRDTWYGNPSAQINVWIPLHDVEEESTFVFYPSCFATPVNNDSAELDREEFVRRAGFKDGTSRGVVYPRATADVSHLERVGFSAKAGDILLFSAAHLHEPRRNTTRLIRFSVDMRMVHVADHLSGRGAPNVDNGSIETSFDNYRPLPSTKLASAQP
ncbi:MAG: hypothetical protein U0165_10440 [Polyangiaceae bacterium]